MTPARQRLRHLRYLALSFPRDTAAPDAVALMCAAVVALGSSDSAKAIAFCAAGLLAASGIGWREYYLKVLQQEITDALLAGGDRT